MIFLIVGLYKFTFLFDHVNSTGKKLYISELDTPILRNFVCFWRNWFLGNGPSKYFVNTFRPCSKSAIKGLEMTPIEEFTNIYIFWRRKQIIWRIFLRGDSESVALGCIFVGPPGCDFAYWSDQMRIENSTMCLYFYKVDCNYICAVRIIASFNN